MVRHCRLSGVIRDRTGAAAVRVILVSGFSAAALGAQAPCTVAQLASSGDSLALGQPVTDIGALSGRYIAWVNVVTRQPDRLPGAAEMLDAIHVRTRPRIVRRELLFAAGDTVDSLQVAESVRRLKHLRYLAHVELTMTAAISDACRRAKAPLAAQSQLAAVGLTVITRDSWSTQPNLHAGSGTAGSVIGLEERNLMGTGRAVKAYLRTDNGRLGAGVGYVDPWLFERDVIFSASRDVFRDGSALQTAVRTHERSVFEPWAVELQFAQTARAAFGASSRAAGDTVRRHSGHILFDRLLASSPAGATRLLFGVEDEQVRETASATSPVIGALDVHRSFAAVDIGVGRRSASYAANDWLLPQRNPAAPTIADIPRGTEGELVAGLGRDFITGGLAIHLDAWGGRMWTPSKRSLITADAWMSGFRSGSDWTAGSVRAALSGYRDATRGLWIAHAAVEQLTDPDPTVRALVTFDPTLPTLPSRNRLAESAVAASLERTLHVRSVSGSYMLDVAAFGAGSFRSDPASSTAERFGVGALGAGIRLSPLREGIATLRLDVGFPVIRSEGISSRPFLAVSISPWTGAGRQRDGRAAH